MKLIKEKYNEFNRTYTLVYIYTYAFVFSIIQL